MLKLLFLLILMPTLFSASIYPQTAPPLETGVSQTLAKWRAANYSDVRYKLNITLEKGAPLMKGTIEVTVKLTDEGAKNTLILDWRTTQFANDKDKPFAKVTAVNDVSTVNSTEFVIPDEHFNEDHLIISSNLLKKGENIIKINFASPIKTSGAAITRYVDKEDGAEYVYSLFVPSDASTAFPVFDQPDLKARFQLTVNAPNDWKVISNTDIKIIENFDNPVNSSVFMETLPISTYVFAFATGRFTKIPEYQFTDDVTRFSKPRIRSVGVAPPIPMPGFAPSSLFTKAKEVGVSIYVRQSQDRKMRKEAAEVFRLNREGVKFLESYFDYKFPFPKYDLVLIPEFPFGGMEHAGATFLRESSVIFPTEPTKNDLVSRANVIFHEAAHQWFGDTVTMKWFDDLWLKEGFAEFMAYKTLERVMPEYNAWKIFYERNKQAAYLTDSTRGTTPIYQEIPNLSAAKSAYGNIVYRKAPSFLKQAEFYLGEKEFQIAVRAFLKKHEFANAEWTDLVKEFETASKQDLKDWANVWVKQKGVPKITALRHLDEAVYDECDEIYTLKQFSDFGDNIFWRMRIKTLISTKENTSIEYDDGKSILDSKLKTKKSEIYQRNNCGLSPEPAKFIFPNYQDYGYGIFLLDEKSRIYVFANIQNEKDDFLRAMMWGALWDSVREGELNPKDYVELVIKNINVETDESTIQTILSRVSTAMNYYLSDRDRNELAPRIETIIFGGMTGAKTSGLRITFFRAYLNVASTEDARVWLRKILESDGRPIENPFLRGALIMRQKLPPLVMPTLRTKDKFDIVTKLLILENRRRILGKFDSEELLAELEKTETSDEAKRYAYAAKAGIGKANNKAKYWNDFTNDKDLSESYIESAFVVFNAPQHSDLTLPYLEKALAELPNLKKNRKIFFVNGWLAAFIGGQKSEEALAIVNKFLADNPNLDKDLRLKILENADGLERAVKIRGKYGN